MSKVNWPNDSTVTVNISSTHKPLRLRSEVALQMKYEEKNFDVFEKYLDALWVDSFSEAFGIVDDK